MKPSRPRMRKMRACPTLPVTICCPVVRRQADEITLKARAQRLRVGRTQRFDLSRRGARPGTPLEDPGESNPGSRFRCGIKTGDGVFYLHRLRTHQGKLKRTALEPKWLLDRFSITKKKR